MGCPAPRESAEALQWLREQSTAALLKHSGLFGIGGYGAQVLPPNPAQALAGGEFDPVPVISGFTRDEGRGLALGMQLMAGGQPMNEQSYRDMLDKSFGDRVQDVRTEYPLLQYPSPGLAWAAIYTDRMFVCPQVAATRSLAARAPAFAYEFADTNAPGFFPFVPGFDPGASHSGELPFLFDVEKKPLDLQGKHVPLTARQASLALTMIRYWSRFAHTGDPNGQEMPHWPRFRAGDAAPEFQILASEPDGVRPARDVLVRHHCSFWEQLTRSP